MTEGKLKGVPVALASAVFLGLTPIFGKQAITAGLPAVPVVALRTLGASLLLFVAMLSFRRQYFYIYPLGLVGCLFAGGLNGLGSLLYYLSLARLDASLGQLLYSLYPLFVALMLYLDGQRYTRVTALRLLLSIPAVVLLSAAAPKDVDLIGVGLMLGASLLYAMHIPINQRVLYEAPAPTVTFYTLLAMTAVVVPALLLFGPAVESFPAGAMTPLILLTLVTFLSRLSLFAGVKSIGGLETSLFGIGELIVTLIVAYLALGESLSLGQWVGASLLMVSLLLVGRDRAQWMPSGGRGWLHWLLPPAAAHLEGLDSSAEALDGGVD